MRAQQSGAVEILVQHDAGDPRVLENGCALGRTSGGPGVDDADGARIGRVALDEFERQLGIALVVAGDELERKLRRLLDAVELTEDR